MGNALRSKLGAVRLTGLLLLLALSSGCTVFKPLLGPEEVVVAEYEKAPHLDNAVKVAESLQAQYSKKVSHMILTERISAVTLIGAAAVGADLAIRSVSPSEVLGIGLGAAALYTGTNYLVGRPQQLIYAAGANAVQCALDAVHPVRIAYRDRNELDALIQKLDTQSRIVDEKVLAYASSRTALVVHAEKTSQEAKNLLPVARETLGMLDNAGGALRSSVAAIQAQVTNAVVTNAPTLQSLVDSLGKSLPVVGGNIVGVALPVKPELVKEPGVKTTQQQDYDFTHALRCLERALARVTTILALANARPSMDKMKACGVDLQQAGLSLQVAPSGDLSVQAGGAALAISVQGGVLPYQPAVWLGPAPSPDQVQLSTETGAGLITITAKSGAATGPYLLLIRDAAKGRATINVAITAGAANKDVTTKSDAKCVEEPDVKEVQTRLIAAGFKTVQINGETVPVTQEGCPGPRTDEAMKQYYKSRGKGITDEQLASQNRKQLTKEVLELLRQEQE